MCRTKSRRAYRAHGALKEWAWGMLDPNCWVSMLCADRGSKGPFAEVWYGSHRSGSATIDVAHGHSRALREIAESHPELLFADDRTLPYQGKLLCVDAPLSIQLHPKKPEAVRLRREKPDEYPDEEPKNEAGIALTRVELLYGYRPVDRILESITHNPEFREVLGKVGDSSREWAMANQTQFLRAVTEAILAADDETIARCSTQLYERLTDFAEDGLGCEDSWILKLKEFYPNGDAGLFFFFVLNLVVLEPGESLAIPVGRLHAYLSGQLIEIMQSGDNVIRVAMTPKFKDPSEVMVCGEFESIDPTALIGKGSYAADARRCYSFEPFDFRVESYEDPGLFEIQPSSFPQFFVSLGGMGSLTAPGDDPLSMVSCDAAIYPATEQVGTLTITSGRIICFRMR